MKKAKSVHQWIKTAGQWACLECDIPRGSYNAGTVGQKALYDLICSRAGEGMKEAIEIVERRMRARNNKPDQLRLDI